VTNKSEIVRCNSVSHKVFCRNSFNYRSSAALGKMRVAKVRVGILRVEVRVSKQ